MPKKPPEPAAEHSDAGNRKTGQKHSQTARDLSSPAHDASKMAYEKAQEHVRPLPISEPFRGQKFGPQQGAQQHGSKVALSKAGNNRMVNSRKANKRVAGKNKNGS